jgi:hypothetical protein
MPAVEALGPDGHTIHVDTRIWEKPSDHVPLVQEFDLSAL